MFVRTRTCRNGMVKRKIIQRFNSEYICVHLQGKCVNVCICDYYILLYLILFIYKILLLPVIFDSTRSDNQFIEYYESIRAFMCVPRNISC